jgi:hypothetical protein
MAFGLKGAPGTFQAVMNETLSSVLRKCAVVFFDDILIYIKMYADHLEHLKQVLQLLQQHQWRVKDSKCQFAQRKISYLGYVMEESGVSTDPHMVIDVQDWPIPTIIKELSGFLGLSSYYKMFVRSHRVLSQPLTLLLCKNVPFVWTKEAQVSFDALKAALTTTPVLALPDFSQRFEIETDALDAGVGAVLLQRGHPLAFVSRGLGPRMRGLSTYEKEYMAILLAVDQWRSYLQHAEFVIHTDHCSLSHLKDQRMHTPWQRRVFTKLPGLQFSIRYKKGATNCASDALSRWPEPEASLCAISQLHPAWILDVLKEYENDT